MPLKHIEISKIRDVVEKNDRHIYFVFFALFFFPGNSYRILFLDMYMGSYRDNPEHRDSAQLFQLLSSILEQS